MIERVKEFFPESIWKRALKGIKKLTPPQEEAIKRGLLETDKNFIIASPTASGKTLIAELAFLKKILEGKKAVYVVPLRSLAVEKFEEFSKKYGDIFKVALSMGDYDSSDPWLSEYDLIIVTSEKLDSLIRHKAEWIKDIGIVIFDEIHILGDPSRGATLEILATKLRMICNPRIIGLSATIENSEEIAKWLDAELVKSDWRPCKLYHLIYFDGKLINSYEKEIKSKYFDPYRAICEDTLKMGKQIIFFLNSRKRAESLAKNLSKITEKFLTIGEKEVLKWVSNEILNVLDVPTEQCEKLAEVVKKGCAFHHAGLLNEQRILVERFFREGYIKAICSTTTLAFGLNLPAFRVVIEKRRRGGWITPVEYHQMAGRAGRPGFEEYGEAILIANSEREIEEIKERYHSKKLNVIKSQLYIESLLRMHLLALISEGIIRDDCTLREFFKRTFYAFQLGNVETVVQKCKEIIEHFIEWGFVERKCNIYFPTRIGKRVSELYIDPITARNFLKHLDHEPFTEITVLYSIASAEEMPRIEFSIHEFQALRSFEKRHENEIPEKPEIFEWDEHYSRLKMVLILLDWINEVSERDIMKKYNIAPGDLRNIVTVAEWLCYSMKEMAKIKKSEKRSFLEEMIERIRYGVRRELVDLVKIKYIGRARARLLFNLGIRNREDIIKAGVNRLKAIFGEKLGERIYNSALGKRIEIKGITLSDYFEKRI